VSTAAAVAAFRGLRAPEVAAGGVNIVLAFSAAVWRTVAPDDAPPSLADFRPVEAPDGRSAPSTQHDAWLWISGASPDVTWEHARAAARAVGGVAEVAAERAGFTYHEGRTGSHVLVMRWVHHLSSFGRLPVAEQERVIGRTKADSVELGPSARPPTAHIARVEIEEDGRELPIYRRSVPYGTVAEHGL
jgi:putative iron-dependent peroxidase